MHTAGAVCRCLRTLWLTSDPVWTSKPSETIAFYVNVLGLSEGDRTKHARNKGSWIYVGDTPQIHLVYIDEDDQKSGTGTIGAHFWRFLIICFCDVLRLMPENGAQITLRSKRTTLTHSSAA